MLARGTLLARLTSRCAVRSSSCPLVSSASLPRTFCASPLAPAAPRGAFGAGALASGSARRSVTDAHAFLSAHSARRCAGGAPARAYRHAAPRAARLPLSRAGRGMEQRCAPAVKFPPFVRSPLAHRRPNPFFLFSSRSRHRAGAGAAPPHSACGACRARRASSFVGLGILCCAALRRRRAATLLAGPLSRAAPAQVGQAAVSGQRCAAAGVAAAFAWLGICSGRCAAHTPAARQRVGLPGAAARPELVFGALSRSASAASSGPQHVGCFGFGVGL